VGLGAYGWKKDGNQSIDRISSGDRGGGWEEVEGLVKVEMERVFGAEEVEAGAKWRLQEPEQGRLEGGGRKTRFK